MTAPARTPDPTIRERYDMKKLLPALFLASAVSAPALAGEVDAAALNTFEAGTPAVAAEVNDNFTALISAINDNAARIAALEDAVPDSIAGNWSMVGLNLELAADSGTATDFSATYSDITLDGEFGSFTFDPAGTFTGTLNATQVRLAARIFCQDNSAQSIPDECVNEFEPETANTSESISGTWTEDGNSVTLALDSGETITLRKGGDDLLILSERTLLTPESSGGGGEASLILVTRD